MNVYEVDGFAKPHNSKFDYYRHLRCKKSDIPFLDRENFNGKPYPKKWKKLELFFDEPLRPQADFYEISRSNIICSQRAKEFLGNVMEKAGEFLPVTIEGEKGTHYVYNVTTCGSFLDSKKSVSQYFDPSKEITRLVAPAFRPDALADLTIFKIVEMPMSEMYCTNAFKELVEHYALTGLRFRLAWNQKLGPVPGDHPPMSKDMGWITGDGKKFRVKQ